LSNQQTGNANLKRVAGEPSSALSLQHAEVATWRDPEWQRLWLAVEAKPWRSLALVPAGEGASLDFTLTIAVALSRTGMVHIGNPIQVADATRVPLNLLTPFLEEVRRCTSNGERLLVALPPTEASPITSSIVRSTDAAILCILLDRMSSSAAKRTVKQIGANRFLGSAIFRPSESPVKPEPHTSK
jgi:hypothetical protein